MVTQQKPSRQPDATPPIKVSSSAGATLAVAYGAISYLVFLGAIVYGIGFVENISTPTTIDSGLSAPTLVAALIDVALLALFAVQHSIMARPRFKAWWTTVIPRDIERSTFVLLASLALLLLFWQWRPIGYVIWQVDNDVAHGLLIAVSLFGWLLAAVSTFLIDHFDLLGLRQVYLAWRRKAHTDPPFRVVALYRLVRHPMMLGFLIAFWAAPRMTAGHLLFSLATTGYVVLAVRYLEERDLVATLGDPYIAYRRQVPMLLPLPRSRRP